MAILTSKIVPQPEPEGLPIPDPISRLRVGQMVALDQSGEQQGPAQFDFLIFRSKQTPHPEIEQTPPLPSPVEVAIWQMIPYQDPENPNRLLARRGPAIVHEVADNLGQAISYVESLAQRKGLVVRP